MIGVTNACVRRADRWTSSAAGHPNTRIPIRLRTNNSMNGGKARGKYKKRMTPKRKLAR